MLFNIRFKVIEIRDGGVVVTHILYGNRKAVKNDIKMFQEQSKRYEMVGKDGMIVWG